MQNKNEEETERKKTVMLLDSESTIVCDDQGAVLSRGKPKGVIARSQNNKKRMKVKQKESIMYRTPQNTLYLLVLQYTSSMVEMLPSYFVGKKKNTSKSAKKRTADIET